ncbi:hypothetical protein KIPE111705_47015 [Kibdelosporangium persicum]
MFGRPCGTAVMAWSITIVCVPDVEDQLAFELPDISRNSERG